MKNAIINLLIVSCFVLPPTQAQVKSSSAAATVSTSSHGNVEAITAEQLREMLTFIAADELEGRDTPSRGLDVAAKFIAYNLARWGLKPAGDNGTFFQRFTLRRGQIDAEQTRVEFNGANFKLGEDFIARQTMGTARGQLVYVAHGLVVKAKNVNAYQGLDVKDKILVVADGAFPKGVQPTDLRGKLGEDYDFAAHYARTHGAKGLIVVPGPTIAERWDRMQRQMALAGQIQLGDGNQAAGDPPAIYASEKMLTVLFQGEKLAGAALLKQAASGEFTEGFALAASKQISLTVGGKLDVLPTQNVVAMLEGSDPVLKHEYVAIGAHYDHVGVRPKADEGKLDPNSRYKNFLESAGKQGGDDRLWNGADDDGSGTVATLAIAEAAAKGPRPKRSLLFVWHAGEEKGLLGSRYVTENPPVPINQIITQLNIDMIGRSKAAGDAKPVNQNLTGPNEIYVIGSKMMSTELGALSDAVNKSYLNVDFNFRYDDPNDKERFFFRSDHYNYARKGVPIIFYFDGVHEDYHQAGDHPEKIDYQKMEKVTRTVLATAWELANRAKRPVVDKQLPNVLLGN